MAKLTKDRARKPLVENGGVWTGTNIEWVPSDEPGMLRSGGDRYTVVTGDYVLSLSEDEMLHTVSEWLQAFNRHRAAEKRHPPVSPEARKSPRYCGGVTCLPARGKCAGCGDPE